MNIEDMVLIIGWSDVFSTQPPVTDRGWPTGDAGSVFINRGVSDGT